VLEPPARAGSPCGPSGIWVLGDVNSNSGKVNKYVNDAERREHQRLHGPWR
jgi:hypothetical protein